MHPCLACCEKSGDAATFNVHARFFARAPLSFQTCHAVSDTFSRYACHFDGSNNVVENDTAACRAAAALPPESQCVLSQQATSFSAGSRYLLVLNHVSTFSCCFCVRTGAIVRCTHRGGPAFEPCAPHLQHLVGSAPRGAVEPSCCCHCGGVCTWCCTHVNVVDIVPCA